MAFAGYQAASTSILKLLAGGIAVKPGLPTLVLAMTAITKGVMYYAILQLSQKHKVQHCMPQHKITLPMS